jgi:hypothetical protein
MSRSGSGKPDPDLEGVELLFHQNGGSASFGPKMALPLTGVDPSCVNSITGSTCRAKCSNILYDTVLMAFPDNQPVHLRLEGVGYLPARMEGAGD